VSQTTAIIFKIWIENLEDMRNILRVQRITLPNGRWASLLFKGRFARNSDLDDGVYFVF
jgi:hypothetical protein